MDTKIYGDFVTVYNYIEYESRINQTSDKIWVLATKILNFTEFYSIKFLLYQCET
jgi:hypothetical protein